MQSGPMTVSTASRHARHPGTVFCPLVSAAQQPQHGNLGCSPGLSARLAPTVTRTGHHLGRKPPRLSSTSQPAEEPVDVFSASGGARQSTVPVPEQPQPGNQNPVYPKLRHGPCRRPLTPAAILGMSRLGSLSAHRRARSWSMSSVHQGGNNKAPQA
ncbi:hypothetical protein NDU88_003839 [Pleurodeles waltl]|uniref:Uncharacterized protein n=1 Tax=Pleurodeles waltl TaxID=8319 RepID=A0AAV7SH30_PLEWA|nr:hypothetical protein NDU88_003839 [Pleurodeles waltl]